MIEMDSVYAEADARLNRLGEAIRKGGGVRVEFGGISIPVITFGGRVTVACHRRPWNGPLHFCVYGGMDDPCRTIGRGDQVVEVAGVVVRMVRS